MPILLTHSDANPAYDQILDLFTVVFKNCALITNTAFLIYYLF